MIVSQVEFERSVHRGLGRAVQWLLNGEVVADRNFLLYACTHNLAYDRQTEENRALYMFDMIRATGEPEFYARTLEQALGEISDNEDEWDDDERSIYQIYDLLGLLAKSGDLSAKQSVYSFFVTHEAESDSFWAEVIVDVGGLDGYLFIVRQWMQLPRKEDDPWYEAWVLEHVEKRFGAEEAQLFLEQAALTEPAIGVYLAQVREKQAAWKARLKSRPKRRWPDYAGIREQIFDASKQHGPMVWARYGEHLPAADAEQMARETLAETDPKRLARYLLLFKRRPFPLDHRPLLTLAQSEEQEVATAARAALAQIEHPSVRALALEFMPTSLRPWELIEMLIRNFCTGDEQAIERVLRKAWDADEMHWLTLNMRHLVEAKPRPELRSALMQIY